MANTKLFADVAIGQLTGGPYSIGATTVTVTTTQGTFPVPAAGQEFDAVINPNTSSLLDNATTERVVVTANSSGTWTIPGALAHAHSNGEIVALVIDTSVLLNLLQLTGGVMSGVIDMGSNKITGLATATNPNDAVPLNQIPATPSLISSLVLLGHSYLGASGGFGVPEPETQNNYFSSKLMSIFHVDEANVQALITAGADLFLGGQDGSGWDSVFQKVLPTTAAGLVATSSGAIPVAAPRWPASGQPASVVVLGVNDYGLKFQTSVVTSTFTGTLTASTGVISSTTPANLSGTGTFLNGRVGGNGVHTGDYIAGPGIGGGLFGRAKVTNVTSTTVTVDTGAILSNSSGTYTCYPGATTQMATAFRRAYEGVITRFIAGNVIRSDDTAITYPTNTGWSTQTPSGTIKTCTGPTYRQTANNADSFSYTIPASFPGGVLTVVMVGTSDMDSSGCSVTWGGTAPNIANFGNPASTTIGGQGWAGYSVPVVARFVLTGADAGGTVVGTFNVGTGGSPLLILDHISFDATWCPPVVVCNQPPGVEGNANTPFSAQQAHDTAITNAVATFTGTNGGSGVTVGAVTNNYSQVQRSDLAGLISRRSFWLGTNLASTGSTATGVTLMGQRTVTQADQIAPYVGQYFGLQNPSEGQPMEIMQVTAVTSGANTTINAGAGGVPAAGTYPTWTVTLARNVAPPWSGALGQIAASGFTAPTAPMIQVWDVTWTEDGLHPNQGGGNIFASSIASQIAAMNLTYDQAAAAGSAWSQNRTRTLPRFSSGGYLKHRGITCNCTFQNQIHAQRFVTGERIIVDSIGVNVVTSASGVWMFAGLALPSATGSYPYSVLNDFTLTSVQLNATGWVDLTGGYQIVPPGEFWVLVAISNAAGVTLRAFQEIMSDLPIAFPSGAAVPTSESDLNGFYATAHSTGTTGMLDLNPSGGAGVWTPASGRTQPSPVMRIHAISHTYYPGH